MKIKTDVAIATQITKEMFDDTEEIARKIREVTSYPVVYYERAMEARNRHRGDNEWSFVDYARNNAIDMHELFIGVMLILPTIVGFAVAAVVSIDHDEACAANQDFTYFLEYDEGRRSWVCIGSGNMDAINKLTLGD